MGFKRTLKNYLIIISVLFPVFVFGQEQFYANTDAREVLTNSYFEVRFVLENASGSDFVPPDFSPFIVISGPSTSSQISIVNGRRSQKKSYVFTLLANSEGIFTIGSAAVRVGRRTLSSNPLEIKVVKRKSNGTGDDRADDFFVTAEISDSVVYAGEQILLRYVLYTRKRIGNYNFLSNPDYEGFYVQEIDSRNSSERRILDGIEYQVQTLKILALFPQKTGSLYIPPLQLSLGLVERNDPFSTFFNQTKQIPVSTNENWIEVEPLPGGAPDSYNGAIGNYRMTTNLSQRQATTDDALSFKLSIEGNGLAKFIEAPQLDLDSNFDVYDPRVVEERSYVTEKAVISKKTFEYLLVPKSAGTHKVQTSFSYFDTDSARYETIHSQAFNVIISKGTNNASGLTPQEILEKYQLKPMMLDTQLSKSPTIFYRTVYYYVLVVILLLSLPGLLAYKWYLIRQGRIDPAEQKKRKAAKEASNRLMMAKNLLDSAGDNKAFYKAISDALEKYIADKFSIQTAELSKDRIRQQLKEKEVDKNDIDKYFEILSNCELALFGGISTKANKELYENADILLQKMLVDLEKTKK